jgi:hypothetical protein
VAKFEEGEGGRKLNWRFWWVFEELHKLGTRNICNGAIEAVPKREILRWRGQLFNTLVEAMTKREVGEIWREIGHSLVKVVTKREMGDRRRKARKLLLTLSMKHERRDILVGWASVMGNYILGIGGYALSLWDTIKYIRKLDERIEGVIIHESKITNNWK